MEELFEAVVAGTGRAVEAGATVTASSVPTVDAATMAQVDRLAVEEYGITLLQMMEQAGSHLAEVVRLELGGDLQDRSIVVAVGAGNNGGGGLVAARHLVNRGASVRVVLARPVLRMTEAGRHQLATLIAMGASCCVATYDLTDQELEDALARADLVVDALVGYNIQGAPRGEVERLVGFIVRSRRPVVSLDVPTGVDPDTGEAAGIAITASATMTLALPKAGLIAGEGAARAGRLYLADIGLPAALYAQLGFEIGLLFAAGPIVNLDLSR
ncbi:MAG: NAD(P)H-hydrate epimerase [Candidatus Limnocylindrales bacterium]